MNIKIKTHYLILVYVILIALAAAWMFPLVSMGTLVIKSPAEFNTLPFWSLPEIQAIPGNFSSNLRAALVDADIGHSFLNSVIYAMIAGIGSAFLASLAGFSLVHLRIRASQSWFMSIFIGNMFPFQMFLIPLYLFLNALYLYDTRLGLALVYLGICIPFALFVYRNYAFTLPRDFFDAAKVDGATKWGAFYRIFFPMTIPAFAVVFCFQFLWTWNDLLFGLILSERYRPVMTALMRLSGARGAVPEPILVTGAIVASLPTIIVLLVMLKFFARGFTLVTEK